MKLVKDSLLKEYNIFERLIYTEVRLIKKSVTDHLPVRCY